MPGRRSGPGGAATGERAKPFLRLADALVDRRKEILDVIQLETGRARRHAMEEFLDVALCSLYYARRARSC